MKGKNLAHISGGDFTGAQVHVGDKVTQVVKRYRRTAEHFPDTIGANLAKRNYVKYLVERYHRYRDADASFGRMKPYSYAVIYKNIEAKFKATAYLMPEGKFEELVDYLYGRINATIVGKQNHARGIPNYKSFDEYVLEHMTPAEPVHA